MNDLPWHQDAQVGFDLETTGVNVHADRIITAAVVHHHPERRPKLLTWLIDPGVEVPAEAANVHGWTNDRIQAELGGREAQRIVNGVTRGLSRSQALFEIAGQVALAMSTRTPLVAFNASYDLSLLEAECTRNQVPTLTERLAPKGLSGVVDPFVIDKHYDPYRKGCYKAPGCRPEDGHHECGGCRGGKVKCGGCGVTDKTLTSVCKHYSVLMSADGAHDASTDALATLRLLARQVKAYPELARMQLPKLHQSQIGWRREQMDSLRAYFDRMGKDHDGCNGDWPLQTLAVAS